MHVEPPRAEQVSQNIPEFIPPDLDSEAHIIHLGCGNVGSADPRVLSLDVLPLPAVDIVAEAESLPVADESVDHLTSGATFEHVYDPIHAGAEVRRVLKRGGGFYIDTAFLQSYHGFPSHYFNMTAQAAETYLVDDLDVVYASSSPSGSPAIALGDLIRRLLDSIPDEHAEHLRGVSLGELVAQLEPERYQPGPVTSALTEHTRRAMAAAIVVIARKPVDYVPFPDMGCKRAYYTARTAIIEHHHHAQLLAGSRAPALGEGAAPNLDETLESLSRIPWPERAARAEEEAERLLTLRNYWRDRL